MGGRRLAVDHRGISANMMYDVVLAWCQILENEFADWDDYDSYGTPLFLAVSKKYGFGIVESEFDPSEDW